MDKKLFEQLLGSVREAGQIMRGERKAARVTEFSVPDVRKIRKKAGLSQSEFARLMRVSPKTLQNWEQKRRNPNGPAAALLKVVERDPAFVLKALHPHKRAA